MNLSLKKLFARLLPTRPSRFSCAGQTDTGRVRRNNEDAFLIMEGSPVFLVADGMGGHNGGEVASRVALEVATDYFSRARLRKMRGNHAAIRHSLITAFRKANAAVIDMAASDETLTGMGCTLLACLIDGNFLHTCHVGDARCYLAAEHRFFQITRDHVFIPTDIPTKAGRAKKKKAKKAKARQRPMLTRAIGFDFAEDPECHSLLLNADDRILLCSDGLWNMVDDSAINAALRAANTPESGVRSLVRMANEAGGHDNITAVAIYYRN